MSDEGIDQRQRSLQEENKSDEVIDMINAKDSVMRTSETSSSSSSRDHHSSYLEVSSHKGKLRIEVKNREEEKQTGKRLKSALKRKHAAESPRV